MILSYIGISIFCLLEMTFLLNEDEKSLSALVCPGPLFQALRGHSDDLYLVGTFHSTKCQNGGGGAKELILVKVRSHLTIHLSSSGLVAHKAARFLLQCTLSLAIGLATPQDFHPNAVRSKDLKLKKKTLGQI